MAMPPRMLPTATPTLPDSDALATIAISGRFVASASRIRPPSADPRCSRVASTSVWSESWMPATQIAAAAAAKIASRTSRGSPDTAGGSTRCARRSGGRAVRAGVGAVGLRRHRSRRLRLGLGHDLGQPRADPPDLFDQRLALVRHRRHVGLHRLQALVGVLVEPADLLVGAADAAFGVDARPRDRALRFLLGARDDVAGALLRAGEDLLGLRLGARGRVLGLFARAGGD